MKIEVVRVRPLALRQFQAAAVETYRKEAAAVLIGYTEGMEAVILGLHCYQLQKKHTRYEICTHEESDYRLQDWLGTSLVGDWHSHPEAHPTATGKDKEEWLDIYTDGSVMIITSVWPTKREPGFSFKHKAYTSHLGRICRVRVLLFGGGA